MFILISLLIVYTFVLIIICYEQYYKKKFNKQKFIDMFGENNMKCGVYYDYEKNISTLLPQKIIYMKMKDLISGNLPNEKNIMCKIKFTDKNEKIAQYFDDITGNKKWDEITIRFSYGKWNFPEHYDCVENDLFIIEGERKAIIEGKYYHFKKGDKYHIKLGEKHLFWSDCNGLNILVNLLNIKQIPVDVVDTCNDNFSKDYPTQDQYNKTKFWKPE